MDWHNLPQAMRDLPQWVCANEQKEPLDPHTGQKAATDDPKTWGTFDEAVRCAIWNALDIGFVLSVDDPFSIIDLDNKEHNPAPEAMLEVHRDILDRADTYIERSISGTGYHLVVLGKPSRPVKTPHVEQYGSLRMMVCTGDIYKDMEPADGTELLELIDHHFGSMSVALSMDDLPDYCEGVELLPDEEIIQQAMDASNGERFERLWLGDKSDYHDDHSAADMALLNLLCFYTPHNEQVRQLFMMSALYRPDWRNRQVKYMNYGISKWRAENMPIDLNSLKFPTLSNPEPAPDYVATSVADPLKVETIEGSDIDLPPGLIGDLAKFCYKASYRQVKEGSVVAAIGYIAGLIARSYHVNGVGLNQYMVFLAGSGVGKEGAKKAVRRIHKAVSKRIASASPHIASGDFSSGVAFVKELAKAPCFMSMMGEIGQTMQLMLDPKAPSVIRELKKAITEAWSESGPDGHMSSRRYSDSAKASADVASPCATIIGESVPEEFYKALSGSIANDGFLPRWLVFEYPGDRQGANRNRLQGVPDELLQRICDLYVAAKSIIDHGEPYNIQCHPQAGMMLGNYEDYLDECIRAEPKGSPTRAVLNRSYEKSIRLAGLFAAADNPYAPVITVEYARLAMKIVERADQRMLEKFKSGDISSGGRTSEDQFVDMIQSCIRAYIEMTPTKRINYKCPPGIADKDVIPFSYLRDQLKRRVAFAEHPAGALRAVDMAIKAALDEGVIVKIGAVDKRAWAINQDLFRVAEGFRA